MMAWPTLIFGALLVLIGIVSYGTGTPNAETGQVSPTTLIPAGFGAVLILCGVFAFNDRYRKHTMHFAAMVGLLGAVGGLMPLIRQVKNNPDGGFDPLKRSAVAGELMILVCLVFVGMCVNSFVQARKARKAAAAPPAGV